MDQSIRLKLYIHNSTMVIQLPYHFKILDVIDFLRDQLVIDGFIENQQIVCKDYSETITYPINQKINVIKISNQQMRQLLITYEDIKNNSPNYLAKFNDSKSKGDKVSKQKQIGNSFINKSTQELSQGLLFLKEHDFVKYDDFIKQTNLKGEDISILADIKAQLTDYVQCKKNLAKAQNNFQKKLDDYKNRCQQLEQKILFLVRQREDKEKARNIELQSQSSEYKKQIIAIHNFFDNLLKKHEDKSRYVKMEQQTKKGEQIELRQILFHDELMSRSTHSYLESILDIYDNFVLNIKESNTFVSDLLEKSVLLENSVNSVKSLDKQAETLFHKSKTLNKYEQNRQKNKFLMSSIQQFKKLEIKRLKNIYYLDEETSGLMKRQDIEDKPNFILLFDFNGKIFGIFSENSISSKQTYSKTKNPSSGFFFSLDEQLALYPNSKNPIWKCSPYQLTIGQKFLDIYFGLQKEKLKLNNTMPIQKSFQIQSNAYAKILGTDNYKKITLTSLEFMTVDFVIEKQK